MYTKFDIWKTDRENPENEHYLDLNIKKDTNSKNYPTLTIWKGKALKPYHYYYYRTLEDRESRLSKIKEQRKKDLADKAKYNVRAKEAIKKHEPDVYVGQIWKSSWGYDQTNIDYYEVVKVNGRAVWFQEIGHTLCGYECQENLIKPDRTCKKGEPFKKILQVHYNDRTGETYETISLNSYSSMHKWDGKISRETNSMFGH